jgi:hypothetical protein
MKDVDRRIESIHPFKKHAKEVGLTFILVSLTAE